MTETYVVLTTVQGQFDEQQIRSFLEAHGIPTRVRGESLRTTHGISIDGIGAVEILVPDAKAGEARQLLDRVERGEFRIDAGEADEGG